MTVRCASLEETVRFGEKLGAVLKAGDVIALKGTLGIGKTQLVRGIARSYLGTDNRVCSPSFTIINQYDAKGRTIYHLDLYRLSTLEEVESTGYWDCVEDPNALVLIEWLEQVDRAQPIEFITIDITFEGDNGETELSNLPRIYDLVGDPETDLYERLTKVFKEQST